MHDKFRYYNPNSCGARVGDCAVRALCVACNIPWDVAYQLLCDKGFKMCDMPSSNAVWGAVLRDRGFVQSAFPRDLPDEYTLEDFCRDNPRGVFVVALNGHVVTAVNGHYYDTWDSGGEYPLYYFYKER